jgi:hypothetical protein
VLGKEKKKRRRGFNDGSNNSDAENQERGTQSTNSKITRVVEYEIEDEPMVKNICPDPGDVTQWHTFRNLQE